MYYSLIVYRASERRNRPDSADVITFKVCRPYDCLLGPSNAALLIIRKKNKEE